MYLYYAPPLSTPGGDAPATGTDFSAFDGVNRLSRFTLNSDFTLNQSSKVDVLDVPASRGICCHVGGDIDFDAAGNLYLSTGDDTNPFESAGYSPLDERTNRNPRTTRSAAPATPTTCAARSCGSGERQRDVLRPVGQPVRPGTARTRPEIYAMGFRNPFRISVDKATGVVYVGDYGPDAGTTSSTRGPSGQVEFNRVAAPGNYGWPYCTGTNTSTETYNEWDFASNTGGGKYNCSGGPTNNSFRNTGLTTSRPRSQPGSGTPATPAPRPSSAAAPSPRWAARSTGTTPRRPPPPSSRSPSTGSSSPPSSVVAGSADPRQLRRLPGHHRHLPVGRQAGDGLGVRPGRRVLRARLRHRLLQR
ncbi:PQQ-dependent sugar dehydrogenase [Micromonospora sp. M12]